MTSYSQLGKNGQLGNQMFQYAALYGTAFIRGFDVLIPPDGHRLREVFKLNSAKDINEQPIGIYQEPSYEFNSNIWCIPKNVDIHGYFQSDLYFSHCSDRIREEFEFNSSVLEIADKYLLSEGITFDHPHVSIHVRRGDYLNLSGYHTNIDIQYYRKLVHDINMSANEKLTFAIFSDDIAWCKENLGIDDAIYVDSGYDAADLQIMTRCVAHIIANSSFSWWGAWLSNCNLQNVFAPSQWFGPEGPKEWKTVYPQGWRII